jgi:hypothetical protein
VPTFETWDRICNLYGWPQTFVGAASLTGEDQGRYVPRREAAGAFGFRRLLTFFSMAYGPPMAMLPVSSLVIAISLAACGSSAINQQLEPKPDAETTGVTLVLVPGSDSVGCCRVFTVNPGRTDVTVFCTVVAIDSSGEIVFTGWIPGPPPGRTRPSGFVARPGRHGHGLYRLPVDLAHDSYTAPCRPAAWHGGAPI